MATLTAVRPHPGRGISFPRITRPSVSAGTTVFLAYIFAGLTVQVGVLKQLGVSGPEASNWFFITWMTTGLFSLVLSLFTRQPVSINLSIAALVFIAGSASGFSLAQILGANLVVGVVAVALSLLRLTDAFARIVPPQIAIGVFAGTVMAFMWKTSMRAVDDPIISAPVIGGFLVALLITRSHLVAVITASVVGFIGVVIGGGMPDAGGSMALPQMALPAFDFNPSSLVALGLPLLILTVGVGNLQALAVSSFGGIPGSRKFLRSHGWRGQLGQRPWRRSPGINRRQFHRNLGGACRRTQRVALLGHCAIVRPHDGSRSGCCSGDISGAGPSFVVHPHGRRTGADIGL